MGILNKTIDELNSKKNNNSYDPSQRKIRYAVSKDKKWKTVLSHVDRIWELFPRKGIKLLNTDAMGDCNHNYGLHQSNLGFNEVPRKNADGQMNGTRSMGLRYENEHTVRLHKRDMCPYSEQHLEFLSHIQQSIKVQFPQYREQVEDFMRVNLVVGAQTRAHTDCMRGTTRNFMLLEPGKNFNLKVSPFPKFRSSVVKYDGELWIPHKLDDRNLIMIGWSDKGAHYYLFEKWVVKELEPYGDLKDYISVGIKNREIQVIPWKYKVYQSPKDMATVPLQEVINHATNNPTKKQRYYMKYLSNTDRWETFYGWQLAHQWLDGTDSDSRRIHVFFRPIREETPTARIKTNKNGDPMNYTVYNPQQTFYHEIGNK